jgi:DNA-binding FrmR family transcriptional regulator
MLKHETVHHRETKHDRNSAAHAVPDVPPAPGRKRPVLPSPPRQALGVDPAIKAANLRRLRRIEGQVRGLHKMVEEDRYCADIIVQIASAQEALRGVARAIMRNHLRHCATHAITSGSEQAEAMYDELLELIYKHLR